MMRRLTAFSRIVPVPVGLGLALWVALTLSNCTSSTQPQALTAPANPATTANQTTTPPIAVAANSTVLWANDFTGDWPAVWQTRKKGAWGLDNAQVIPADSRPQFSKALRVFYPALSASPSVSRSQGVPIGGVQFYAELGIPSKDALKLSYFVRFAENFDFVKGGKLPGLFGGTETSGGNIPDGTNGFSTRFMWRKQGDGEVYAYLPSSEEYGTSIGRGAWQFQPGVWHHLEQELTLNQPGLENGRIRVWVDGKLVLDRDKLMFRTTEQLKIEGIFFSTFFGGGDPSWATPKDTYVDFAAFSVSSVDE
ncbi:MAG: polysaccharide lyase [Microcoleaceae cyanobacterium]